MQKQQQHYKTVFPETAMKIMETKVLFLCVIFIEFYLISIHFTEMFAYRRTQKSHRVNKIKFDSNYSARSR